MYKQIIKPIFFLFDPEKIHHFVFSVLKFIGKIPFASALMRLIFKVDKKELGLDLFGLHFPNRVGLAAGFDKDAKLFDELGDLGFGFVEIGTLTPLAQSGNPKPRLFRLPQDDALINRMGFNNDGLDAAVERLKRKRKSDLIIGGNIGKNKITPNEEAVKDYEIGFEKLFDYVDYFVVNVSSPNTPNLRELQDKEPLSKLLNHLQQINFAKKKPKPILLKIAPDLTLEQLNDIVEIYKETKIAGLIVSNTTLDRSNLKSTQALLESIGNGGLSGMPLRDKSTQIIKYLKEKSGPEMKIIAVGGIHSEADAIEKLNAGADLIQLYTGFIYEGPGLVKRINNALLRKT